MALMLRHASSAGDGAAWITLRWMPLENTSPPRINSTFVGCFDGVAEGGGQSAALTRRHRPVVEVEVEHADVALAAVADLAPSAVVDVLVQRLQHVGPPTESTAEGHRRGELDTGVGGADLADPDAAVAGAHEHGVVVPADDRAWIARRRRTGVGVEHRHLHAAERGAHAG